MVLLYWHIGREILAKQEEAEWGTSVIDRLAADLAKSFPGVTGFSVRNLRYMRRLAEAWPDPAILQRVVAELPWARPAVQRHHGFCEAGVIATVSGGKVKYVTEAEIEQFKRTYVAVPELSGILGTKRSRDTIAIMADAGVEPVCPRPPYWKVLYRREEAVAVAHAVASEKLGGSVA